MVAFAWDATMTSRSAIAKSVETFNAMSAKRTTTLFDLCRTSEQLASAPTRLATRDAASITSATRSAAGGDTADMLAQDERRPAPVLIAGGR
jgi:hypothetical protein